MRIGHRSIDYRRTKYRPGLGVCPCPPCHEETARRQAAGEHYELGERFAPCLFLNREEVIAGLWEEANRALQPHRGGILHDLMARQKGGPIDLPLWMCRAAFRLTNRDRAIVATVVQWLGTNVGWCFLERCVRACGYRLVRDEKPLVAGAREGGPL